MPVFRIARSCRPWVFGFGFLVAALLVPPAGTLWAAEAVQRTGTVEVVLNTGNGINRYYLNSPEGRYRVWSHILDTDQIEKERLLVDAAGRGLTVTIQGDLEEMTPEPRIRIRTIRVGPPPASAP
jgi:hypothetical protein